MLKSFKAYSLLELLFTLALLSLLLTLALPSFSSQIARTKETLYAKTLLTAIAYARTEAILRHTPITLSITNEQGIFIRAATHTLHQFTPSHLPGQLHQRSRRGHIQSVIFTEDTVDNTTWWYCAPDADQPSFTIFLNLAGRARLTYQHEAQLAC